MSMEVGSTNYNTVSQAYTPETQAAIDTLEQIISKYIQGGVSSTDGKDATGSTTGTGAPGLEAPGKDIDVSDLTGLLMILKEKSTDEQMKTAKEMIMKNQAKLKTESEERITKLKEAQDNAEKAKKSGLFGKIFGWIGAIASAIVGAVLIATGVGVAAGALLLAASAVMLTQMIMSEAGAFEKMDPKLAQGLMIAMTVTAAVLGIAGGIAGAVGTTATTMSTIAQAVKIGATIAAGASAIGGGASGIASAVYTKESADAQADAKEIAAFILKIQAAMEDEQDRLKELIEQLDAGFQVFSDIVKQHSETQSKVFQQMSA